MAEGPGAHGRRLGSRVPWHAPSAASLEARFLCDGRGPPPIGGSFPSFGHAVLSGKTRVLSQGRGLLELARRGGKLGIRDPPLPRSVPSRAPAPLWLRSPLIGEAHDLRSVGPLDPLLARPGPLDLVLDPEIVHGVSLFFPTTARGGTAVPKLGNGLPSMGSDQARLALALPPLGRA